MWEGLVNVILLTCFQPGSVCILEDRLYSFCPKLILLCTKSHSCSDNCGCRASCTLAASLQVLFQDRGHPSCCLGQDQAIWCLSNQTSAQFISACCTASAGTSRSSLRPVVTVPDFSYLKAGSAQKTLQCSFCHLKCVACVGPLSWKAVLHLLSCCYFRNAPNPRKYVKRKKSECV